jgi:hypothetical protein
MVAVRSRSGQGRDLFKNRLGLLNGVGVELTPGERLGIGAEWEGRDVETSLDAWSLGAYYRFGKQ